MRVELARYIDTFDLSIQTIADLITLYMFFSRFA